MTRVQMIRLVLVFIIGTWIAAILANTGLVPAGLTLGVPFVTAYVWWNWTDWRAHSRFKRDIRRFEKGHAI